MRYQLVPHFFSVEQNFKKSLASIILALFIYIYKRSISISGYPRIGASTGKKYKKKLTKSRLPIKFSQIRSVYLIKPIIFFHYPIFIIKNNKLKKLIYNGRFINENAGSI